MMRHGKLCSFIIMEETDQMTGEKGGLSGFTVLVAGDDVTTVFLSDVTDKMTARWEWIIS
jgi:hypothetical protein